mmetsp:Transcript_14065/g.35352  ORF Transcript_14065/g.35352 Transcript_14065/m.35352 type:complete len:276 (+) Transcript_14065:351-1178(+)
MLHHGDRSRAVVVVHVIGNVPSKRHDRIGRGCCVLFGLDRTSPGKATNKTNGFHFHLEPIKISKVCPKGAGVFLQINFTGLFDCFGVFDSIDISHQVDASIGGALEIFIRNRQTAFGINKNVLGVAGHATEHKERASFVVHSETNNTSTRKARIRFAVGAHDRESVVVLHERADIRRIANLWNILLVTKKFLHSLLLFRCQVVNRRCSLDIVCRSLVKERRGSASNSGTRRIDQGVSEAPLQRHKKGAYTQSHRNHFSGMLYEKVTTVLVVILIS